jgi:hypothetical protein
VIDSEKVIRHPWDFLAWGFWLGVFGLGFLANTQRGCSVSVKLDSPAGKGRWTGPLEKKLGVHVYPKHS